MGDAEYWADRSQQLRVEVDTVARQSADGTLPASLDPKALLEKHAHRRRS